jgi:hypothetical protein
VWKNIDESRNFRQPFSLLQHNHFFPRASFPPRVLVHPIKTNTPHELHPSFFSHSLDKHVPYGIRCNVLAPGYVQSVLAAGVSSTLGEGKGGGDDENVIPAGRVGNEEDVAGAVLYMASRAGAYLNGSVIVVDGGR